MGRWRSGMVASGGEGAGPPRPPSGTADAPGRHRGKGRGRFSEDGETGGISGTALDITEQRRIEDALRAQEERYRLVIEHLEDLIVRTDPDGRFDFVSPSYCRLVGIPEEELLGTHCLQLVHPDDRKASAAATRQLLLPPHVRQIEQRVETVAGWRWLQWVDRAVLDEAGQVQWVVAVGRDITERRQAEFDLLQREQLERGLLELSAVFLQRPELGMDHLINKALARMGQLTGTDRAYLFSAEVERRTFSNTHEWTAPGVAPMIDRLQNIPWDATPDSMKLLAAGSPVVIPRVAELAEDWAEKAFLESQGIRSLLILPVMQGENLTGFVGFDTVHSLREWSSAEIHFLQVFASLMVSAIEREQAYTDMVAARERETIGHLASGVAHDFNNLLGVIDANFFYLQQTLIHPGAEPEVAQILEETHSALGQAKVVTSGMLSLSRAGAFTGERVMLDAAITELARILRQVLPPETHLVLALEPELAVCSNRAFLQAALLNLVLNARDAMPDGGRLTIEAVGAARPCGGALTIGERESGRYALLRVADTGSGMETKILDRLFEPLFSTKAQRRGHGLGMFMVHEFVLRSGALLEVDSRVDEGSEFRLFLPAWAGDQAESGEFVGSDMPGAPCRLRVLVVDDDPRSRDSVRRLLEIDGIRVETAEDGAACLEWLRRDPDFDLVLSDVSMPHLDGVGLCQALLEAYPTLPVILMTGQAPTVFPREQIPGAPMVLRKPLDVQMLRAAIARLNLPGQ